MLARCICKTCSCRVRLWNSGLFQNFMLTWAKSRGLRWTRGNKYLGVRFIHLHFLLQNNESYWLSLLTVKGPFKEQIIWFSHFWAFAFDDKRLCECHSSCEKIVFWGQLLNNGPFSRCWLLTPQCQKYSNTWNWLSKPKSVTTQRYQTRRKAWHIFCGVFCKEPQQGAAVAEV